MGGNGLLTGDWSRPDERVKNIPTEKLKITLHDLERIERLPDGIEWLYHSGTPKVHPLFKWNMSKIDYTDVHQDLKGQFWTDCLINARQYYLNRSSHTAVFELSRWEIHGLIDEGWIALFTFTNELDETWARVPNKGHVKKANNGGTEYVIIPHQWWTSRYQSEWEFFLNRHRIPTYFIEKGCHGATTQVLDEICPECGRKRKTEGD